MHDCFIFTTQKLVLSTGMLVYFTKGQKYRILKSLNRPTEISSSYHRVVNSPSTPTGPRAWIRLVLIPTYTAIEENQIQENDLDILTKFYRKLLNDVIPRHLVQTEPHHKIWYLHCEKQQHCQTNDSDCIVIITDYRINY